LPICSYVRLSIVEYGASVAASKSFSVL
jgi:hypothetical protein